MVEIFESECFLLEKGKILVDVKCFSSIFLMLKICVLIFLMVNEFMYLFYSDYVEVIFYNEKEMLVVLLSLNFVKMIWVV